ncbi:hypothetical protein LSUB1_G005047 [Lachnellula subtilissima]|uniref:Uncharacterized protein n=1 Tax=Lachnellula subtilissima TaxID=602034 RepID=A0A8H8RQG5_9HELO|nr:hypothetical protein LSUB1_G005047 [Lachnellula subtilissima]
MPAFSPASLINTATIISRNATAIATNASIPNAANTTALQVICAWPVSGQYGPGSRILYYVLIAACVFARNFEWLRNACTAAALILPAVAAIHGIVLAAVPMHGAVDMDVYGAFQLCSIGILTAPVTVKLSRTYFYDPGRNAIFAWTGLVLAGLLSLTVEFFRIKSTDCTHADDGTPMSSHASDFPYGIRAASFVTSTVAHSLQCEVVQLTTYMLTFGTATLFSAACCIPAILSLVSMWNKILEVNWKTRFGEPEEEEQRNETISGTNGATIEKMKGVNAIIRSFLSAVEVPVFGAAILAILIIGERNFFSRQVVYQTEPWANIGQWAPIVGAGLAVLGSLYLLLAADLEAEKEETNSNPSVHNHHHHSCNCSLEQVNRGRTSSARSTHSVSATPGPVEMRRSDASNHDRPTSLDLTSTITRHPTTATKASHQLTRSGTGDVGNRRKVAKALNAIGNQLGTAAHFDNSEFKHGKALDFPEIPGEDYRNRALPQIRMQYNQVREDEPPATPLRRQHSRASSFHGSIASGLGIEGVPTSPRATSPPSPHSPSTSTSARASTLPVERPTVHLENIPTSSSSGTARPARRRDTLEVPSPVHHSHMRNTSASSVPIINKAEDEVSPAIVVSPEPEMIASPAASPVFNPHAHHPPSPPPTNNG